MELGIGSPNCAPTSEAHKASHQTLFTWLARLDKGHIVACLIYSNYNRAGLFKMHVNDCGVDLVYDSVMLIL